jgi:hypothetical protein
MASVRLCPAAAVTKSQLRQTAATAANPANLPQCRTSPFRGERHGLRHRGTATPGERA